MKRKELQDYCAAGVDYTPVDHLKRMASEYARTTEDAAGLFGFSVIPESRGESAFLIKMGKFVGAFVQEGLGTKNIIVNNIDVRGPGPMEDVNPSNEVCWGRPETYYEALAWDTVATIVNDLATVGAQPVVICPHWAAGSSTWFENKIRNRELYMGWLKACSYVRAVYGPGETAILSGMIDSETIEMSGSGFGVIVPPLKQTLGESLSAGDHIVLIGSSGIHANGLTLARRIAEEILPQGFLSQLPSGKTFANALLTPTIMYSPLQKVLFEREIDIHYMVNITGHGWRKLMRARFPFTYNLHTVPEPQEEFRFMQQAAQISDYEMYATFNMGSGYALMVPEDQAGLVVTISQKEGLEAWDAGIVEEGPRQVIIGPKKITYQSDTFQIR